MERSAGMEEEPAGQRTQTYNRGGSNEKDIEKTLQPTWWNDSPATTAVVGWGLILKNQLTI